MIYKNFLERFGECPACKLDDILLAARWSTRRANAITRAALPRTVSAESLAPNPAAADVPPEYRMGMSLS